MKNNITNIATITGITGAILLALNMGYFLLAYTLFIISSVLWSVFAHFTKNNQLLIMNVVFTIINILGLLRYSGTI